MLSRIVLVAGISLYRIQESRNALEKLKILTQTPFCMYRNGGKFPGGLERGS